VDLRYPIYIFFEPAEGVGNVMLDDTIYRAWENELAAFVGAIGVHRPECPFTIAVGEEGDL